MLHLWKKIQEKGYGNSLGRKESFISTLDPRYDGPLKDFETNSIDCKSLEKCYLILEFSNIFEDKTAYNYFKGFLDSRQMSEILDIWKLIAQFWDVSTNECENTVRNNNIYYDKDNNLQNEKQTNNNYNMHDSNTKNLVILQEKLSELPDDLRQKLFSHLNKSSVDNITNINIQSLRTILYEICLNLWNDFIRSEWYCRYQVDLLTSKSVMLGDILHHEVALSYFMQFLEIEGCRNVLEFLLATKDFQQFAKNATISSRANSEQILNEAINIYEKYLSLQASCPLGFNNEIRCAVEEAICDEVNGPNGNCFEPAVNVVYEFLRKRYLIPFFSSQHYVHLLSEMIRSSSFLTNHSPTSSISDISIESKNPSLSKLDPDSIWRQRKQSGLSFGHIDQLGRFQRDIEPDPDSNNESKISKIMKKWVQKSEDRMKQEMAWQVAEMVIKDITDLTMKNHLQTKFERNGKKCKIQLKYEDIQQWQECWNESEDGIGTRILFPIIQSRFRSNI